MDSHSRFVAPVRAGKLTPFEPSRLEACQRRLVHEGLSYWEIILNLLISLLEGDGEQ